jgi:hypothetical protein
VDDGDALWQGHEDVTPSLGANGGATSRGASASSDAGEWAEGLLKGGGDARLVHSMAQNPFQDDMVQRNLWGGWSIACRGGCPCGGGWLRSHTAQWGILEQDGEAKAMSEGSLELRS